MEYELIGKRIKKARRDKGITQERFAEELGVSVSFISQVETGEKRFNLERITEVSKILERPLNYFIDGYEEKDKSNNSTSLFGKKEEEKSDNKPLINDNTQDKTKIFFNSKGSLAADSSNPFLNYSKQNTLPNVFNANTLGRTLYANNVSVYITLFVYPDAIIKDLTVSLQKDVKDAIKKSLDLDVKDVNVKIKNITPKKDV